MHYRSLPFSVAELLLSVLCLYTSVLISPANVRDPRRRLLGVAALVLSALSQYSANVQSVLLKASILSAGISVVTKTLDLCFLRRAAPVWLGKPISKWQYAALLTFGHRFENFDIYVPTSETKSRWGRHDGYSGLISAALVAGILFLDGFPTSNSYWSSLVALLCLHISFSVISIFLEDPLTAHHPFLSASLSSFWTKGWHQLFSAGLKVIAYDPVVRATGIRGLGVLAAFAVSGAWHAVQLRTFWFFTLNGVGVSIDGGLLRRIPNPTLRPLVRRLFAWAVLWYLAAWTARGWPSIRVFHKDFIQLSSFAFKDAQESMPEWTGWLHRQKA